MKTTTHWFPVRGVTFADPRNVSFLWHHENLPLKIVPRTASNGTVGLSVQIKNADSLGLPDSGHVGWLPKEVVPVILPFVQKYGLEMRVDGYAPVGDSSMKGIRLFVVVPFFISEFLPDETLRTLRVV